MKHLGVDPEGPGQNPAIKDGLTIHTQPEVMCTRTR